ncbi:MAG TPA: helix-turn-helix domain-containing protein [Acidimicrobiales bacterium]|nr:helix-turn-helix domain-containing protein [Acidimicrobiales bacterium]
MALELMAEHGFAATSTREISERLGFTKAALYYHFRTKDDLLEALLAPAVGRLTTLVQAPPRTTGPAARRALLAGYIAVVADNVPLMRVMATDPSVVGRPALEGVAPLYGRLGALLAGTDAAGVAARARVRAALGGIHSVFRGSDPDDDPALLREAALAAACGALGLPAVRR